MYRFIIFTIQIILLVIILTFLFSNPFIISLDIGNLKYSFTSNGCEKNLANDIGRQSIGA